MHKANKMMWEQYKEVYPNKFKNVSVLEVGSINVNGTIRDLFEDCEYIGVDWREGPGCDVVSLAHEMDFKRQFDVIASASMLEHDPYWQNSLDVMHKHLKPDGILMLTWGAAENEEHCNDTAPDGLFHSLPAYKVVKHLDNLGMYIERFEYERQLCSTPRRGAAVGWGEVGLVAFHNWKYGLGIPLLSHYRIGDDEPVIGFAGLP